MIKELSAVSEEKLLSRNLALSQQKIDLPLLWLVILMTAFSLLMIYSASVPFAEHENGSSWFYLRNQLVFLFVAIGAGGVAFSLGMAKWQKWAYFLMYVALALLGLVLAVGRNINGATRWIDLGPVNFQPTEFFKLIVIMYLANFIVRRQHQLDNLRIMMSVGILIGVGFGAIMWQPDFGSFVVSSVIVLGMLFLAALPTKWFIVLLLSSAAVMTLAIVFEPYRVARVAGFLDPWADPNGKGHQLSHALMAIARGDWFGVGIGASIDKRYFLSEAHTDFIFAVIGEEFGFLGLCVLVFCYGWLVWRAFSIAQIANELNLKFNALVAQGIGIWIGIQSFFNLGVNVGILPTKGLTLPFISYGGSSVVMMMICIGLLLRVDYENRNLVQGRKRR
ncbi:MAG: putative lipid II flippase FtsW [Neisseria sp.]|nr:putative lipid II flippase FtsW [Neisseria sp.]